MAHFGVRRTDRELKGGRHEDFNESHDGSGRDSGQCVRRECSGHTSRAGLSPSGVIKASDDFLDPLFQSFFEKLSLPNLLRKTDYHVLARLVPKDKIDPEVIVKLDGIVEVATKAKPKET